MLVLLTRLLLEFLLLFRLISSTSKVPNSFSSRFKCSKQRCIDPEEQEKYHNYLTLPAKRVQYYFATFYKKQYKNSISIKRHPCAIVAFTTELALSSYYYFIYIIANSYKMQFHSAPPQNLIPTKVITKQELTS